MEGTNIAVAVLCFGLAVSMLSGLGFYSIAGTDTIAPGIQDDVERVDKNASEDDFTLEDSGGVFGFFDLAKAAIDGVTMLWVMITSVDQVFVALGLGPNAANAMETLASVVFWLGLIQIVRGYKF